MIDMRVYLAGPMTGIEDYNFPAFNMYAKTLRKHGYIVVNPAEIEAAEEGPRKSWDFYLRRDIRELIECDGIAVLPGWEKSKGANLEVYIGWRLGMKIFDAVTLLNVDVSQHDFSKVEKSEQNKDAFMKAFSPIKINRLSEFQVDKLKEAGSVTGDLIYSPEKQSLERKTQTQKENILEEANRIVGGDRAKAYGHPKTDFERTALIWSAILGIKVKAEQVPLCMVGVKMSRQCNAAKRDNWVDIAGYAQTGYMVDQKDGRME